MAIGIYPIWVVVELDAAYQHLSGDLRARSPAGSREADATLSGATLTPTGAIVGQF